MAEDKEQEKKDAFDAEQARQQRESYKFMRATPQYVVNEANARTIRNQMLKMGLGDRSGTVLLAANWTAANLLAAYAQVDPELWRNENDSDIKVIEVEAPQPPPPPDPNKKYPWGKELVGIEGRKFVHDLDAESMLKFLKDAEFVRQLDALGVTQKGRY